MTNEDIIDYLVLCEESFHEIEIILFKERDEKAQDSRVRFPEFSGLCFNLGTDLCYSTMDDMSRVFKAEHYNLIHTKGGWLTPHFEIKEVCVLFIKLPLDFMALFEPFSARDVINYCAATRFKALYLAFKEPAPISESMRLVIDKILQYTALQSVSERQCIYEMVIDLVRLHLAPHTYQSRLGLNKSSAEKIEKARNLLLTGYTKTWNADMLADAIDMNRKTMSAKFKDAFGRTPMEYLREFRLKLSVELLNQGMSVGDVAKKMGYKFPQDFNRAFKKEFKCSPFKAKRLIKVDDKFEKIR